MRWPIKIQLLLPILSVVVLAIVLASAASAYLGTVRARREQEENLHRVIATVTDTTFPLTERVLRQISGFSGADFVYFDENQDLQYGTLPLSGDDLRTLGDLPQPTAEAGFGASPVLVLAARPYLAERVPVAARGTARRSGSLVVLYPEDRWSAVIRQAAYPALTAGALAAAVAVAITTVLAQRFVRPIRQLRDQTAAIVRGDFRPVAVSRRNDEIRDLAVAINQMTEKLSQYEAEVRRNERLRTLGQLGAGMAHQLRNAATGARMAIELHQRECPGGPTCESLDVALRQMRLMESYLQRLLALGARPGPSQESVVSLGCIVEEALDLVRPACVHAGVELSLVKPVDEFRLHGDPEALRQLVINLAHNALEAAAADRCAAPRVAVELDRGAAGRAVLRVKDTGSGPAAEVQTRLFEPFVTGKPDGTGLGLFVARQIAEAHRGSIGWDRQGDMTCFTVELPLDELWHTS